MKVYHDIRDLAKAINAGEIEGAMQLDNDTIDFYDEDGNNVFNDHPASALVEALTLLGIESEYV